MIKAPCRLRTTVIEILLCSSVRDNVPTPLAGKNAFADSVKRVLVGLFALTENSANESSG
jgi:hypothetical protein